MVSAPRMTFPAFIFSPPQLSEKFSTASIIKSTTAPTAWKIGPSGIISNSSLYYKIVVFKVPLQGLCYTVRDAVDWLSAPTARRFLKGSNHSSLQYC